MELRIALKTPPSFPLLSLFLSPFPPLFFEGMKGGGRLEFAVGLSCGSLASSRDSSISVVSPSPLLLLLLLLLLSVPQLFHSHIGIGFRRKTEAFAFKGRRYIVVSLLLLFLRTRNLAFLLLL